LLYTIDCPNCKHSFRRISTNPGGPGSVTCPECNHIIKVESSSSKDSNQANSHETEGTNLNKKQITRSDEEFT
jgi:ssDNA-binding Zn-finger/Zn-ribbon topoisomerase 1